jgi:hypothetical protein
VAVACEELAQCGCGCWRAGLVDLTGGLLKLAQLG